MFGNHLLPNIVPQHSFHSPPPSSTHLPLPPPSCAPASAHLGQAGAAHCWAPHMRVPTNNSRHITMRKHLHHCWQPPHHHHRQLPTPCHRHWLPPMPRHYRQQPPDDVSQPLMTPQLGSPPTTPMYATSPPLTTATCHQMAAQWQFKKGAVRMRRGCGRLMMARTVSKVVCTPPAFIFHLILRVSPLPCVVPPSLSYISSHFPPLIRIFTPLVVFPPPPCSHFYPPYLRFHPPTCVHPTYSRFHPFPLHFPPYPCVYAPSSHSPLFLVFPPLFLHFPCFPPFYSPLLQHQQLQAAWNSCCPHFLLFTPPMGGVCFFFVFSIY